MKRVLTITLLIVVLITGCSFTGDSFSSSEAEKLGYFTFPRTDWGITKDEVFSNLKLKEDGFQQEKFEREPYKWTSFTGDYKFLGDTVMIKFEFFDSPLIETRTLRQISWGYTEEYTQEEYEKLREKIKKEICKVEIEESSQVYPSDDGEWQIQTFKSVSKTSTLPDEVKDQYNSFIRYLSDNNFYTNPPENYQRIDFTSSLQSLSVLNIYYIKQANGNKGKVQVSLDGSGIALAKAYIKGYELINKP